MLLTLSVATMMVGLDSSIVTVAIPAIQTALGATVNDVVWVNSVFSLS